jgi:hypothetical protein
VERLKKIEMASDMDEILKEEIREYRRPSPVLLAR